MPYARRCTNNEFEALFGVSFFDKHRFVVRDFFVKGELRCSRQYYKVKKSSVKLKLIIGYIINSPRIEDDCGINSAVPHKSPDI